MFTKLELQVDPDCTISYEMHELLWVVSEQIKEFSKQCEYPTEKHIIDLEHQVIISEQERNNIVLKFPPVDADVETEKQYEMQCNTAHEKSKFARMRLRDAKNKIINSPGMIPSYHLIEEEIKTDVTSFSHNALRSYSNYYKINSIDLISAFDILELTYVNSQCSEHLEKTVNSISTLQKPKAPLLKETPMAKFILPIRIEGMKTPKDWLTVANYLATQHQDIPVSSWWINVGGRLICLRNKVEDSKFLFVSDHGAIPEIINEANACIDDFEFNHDTIDSCHKSLDTFRGHFNKTLEHFKFSMEFTKEYQKNALSVSGKSKYPTYNILQQIMHAKDANYYIVADMLGTLASQINKGSIKPLIRPKGSYGEAEHGDTYTAFAQTILNYQQGSKALRDSQIATIARQILSGQDLTNPDLSFLPNLLAAMNLSETARIDRLLAANL